MWLICEPEDPNNRKLLFDHPDKLFKMPQTKQIRKSFLTLSIFCLTQNYVLGPNNWVKGLHKQGVDDHVVLFWRMLSWQRGPRLLGLIADKSGKLNRLKSKSIFSFSRCILKLWVLYFITWSSHTVSLVFVLTTTVLIFSEMGCSYV